MAARHHTAVRLSDAALARVDALAAAHDMNRSEALRWLLRVGLDEVERRAPRRQHR